MSMSPIAFVLALSLAGCGGGAAADGQSQFLGTWSFSTGDDNVSCPSGTTADKLSGNLTIKTASGGGLVVLDQEGCNFDYELDGKNATTANQSCSFAVPALGQGTTAAVMYDAITLSTSDGKTMSDSFNGTVAYTASTGTLDCIFSGSATLAKLADQ